MSAIEFEYEAQIACPTCKYGGEVGSQIKNGSRVIFCWHCKEDIPTTGRIIELEKDKMINNRDPQDLDFDLRFYFQSLRD